MKAFWTLPVLVAILAALHQSWPSGDIGKQHSAAVAFPMFVLPNPYKNLPRIITSALSDGRILTLHNDVQQSNHIGAFVGNSRAKENAHLVTSGVLMRLVSDGQTPTLITISDGFDFASHKLKVERNRVRIASTQEYDSTFNPPTGRLLSFPNFGAASMAGKLWVCIGTPYYVESPHETPEGELPMPPHETGFQLHWFLLENQKLQWMGSYTPTKRTNEWNLNMCAAANGQLITTFGNRLIVFDSKLRKVTACIDTEQDGYRVYDAIASNADGKRVAVVSSVGEKEIQIQQFNTVSRRFENTVPLWLTPLRASISGVDNIGDDRYKIAYVPYRNGEDSVLIACGTGESSSLCEGARSKEVSLRF